jgi:5'-3' exonuclease
MPTDISTLCFDFNCLIYRCIRAPGMPAPPGLGADPYDIDIWEALLLKEVVKTVKEVWTIAGRPKNVYLAVDGVVPMAKIRQQRVRRFKSAWLRKLTGASNETGWDSNSITPGTAFMDKLTRELEGFVKEQGRGWQLSSIQEAGEGEHKLMRWLSNTTNPGTIIVYGLDADLMLLSMIYSETLKKNLWLLREKQEFGSHVNVGKEQEYSFMNIDELKLRVGVKGVHETVNYVCLMSLMGNDFLPHSLTHKLNDDGHDCVLQEFRSMKKTGRWIVADERVQLPVLLDVCKRWSVDESDRIVHMMKKKREQAVRGVGKGMDSSEGLPLEWNVESVFVSADGDLNESWRDEYWKFIHPSANRAELCSEYVYGLQWILDYYMGRPVNMWWMFSSWIPPLWSDLAKFLASGAKEAQAKEPSNLDPIQPAEQLAMVLPVDSWGLIRNPQLRHLPLLAPQMWPQSFEFLSVGRKWLWECEARIPVLTAERLREILKQAS